MVGGIIREWKAGPVCIKQLKIKRSFLQSLLMFILEAIMDKSDEGGLKGIGNTMMLLIKSPEHRKQYRNSHLILSCFRQASPEAKGKAYREEAEFILC